MAAKGAAGGFVVTSGSFTQEAIDFASGRNIRLLDGPKLFGLIQQAKTAQAGAGRATRSSSARAAPVAVEAPAALKAISCPICSGAMVQRMAKRGDNAGKAFWGCTGYPSCRGTRPLSGAGGV